MKRTQTKAAKEQALTDGAALNTGLVVGSHGRHCVVETATGQRLICHPRGKKSQSVVGDRVRWQAATDEGTIERVETRRNLFYRQDEIRTKSFAANLDQVLILIAAEPEFSETQLTRALIAAEAEKIQPIIALNKSDLGAPFDLAWQRLSPYRDMGYSMVPLSLKEAQLQADQVVKTVKCIDGKDIFKNITKHRHHDASHLDTVKSTTVNYNTLINKQTRPWMHVAFADIPIHHFGHTTAPFSYVISFIVWFNWHAHSIEKFCSSRPAGGRAPGGSQTEALRY